MSESLQPMNSTQSRLTAWAVPAAICSIAISWAYAPTLSGLWERWSNDAQYSHGYLVPLFAGALLWIRRDQLNLAKVHPSLWGLLPLAIGVAMRLASARFYLDWLEGASLLPTLAGLALFTGGWSVLRWAAPSIGFLIFMVPLPYRIEVALQGPLRSLGTSASTYIMQTCGLPALSEGNVIALGDVRIGVVEACSGLRMLMIFFALTTAVILLNPGPVWRQAIIVLSAVPIALISNIARITLTGMLHTLHWSHAADMVFHDLAGWLMMPFALILLWMELWYLNHLVIIEAKGSVRVGLKGNRPRSEQSATPVSVP